MQAKPGRWSWMLLAALALALAAAPASAEEKQPSEDKVAAVNGSSITQADLDREMRRVQRRLSSMGKPHGDVELPGIREEALETLIKRELIYQESQKEGFKADEAAIDEQLSEIRRQFPSEEEFKNALSEMNFSEASIKSEIARGMAIQKFIEERIVQKITVPDGEVRAYYDGHSEFFKKPEQVRASHILIKVDPQADEQQKGEARKKLETVRQKLEEGEDFAALAKEFSEGPSGPQGGDLGYLGRGQTLKPFEDAAFALKPGEVSVIIETSFGYHLIKVFDRKPETTIPYADVKERLGKYLKQKKANEEVDLYVEKLKGKAKVETFPKEGQK